MGKKEKLKSFLGSKHFTLLIVVILLIILFQILTSGAFLKPFNIRQIFNGMVICSFFTVGVGMLMLFGYMDLSVGAVGSLGGAVLCWLIAKCGAPAPVAMLAGIIVGIGCGLFNGFLVNKLHFEPFIATLAMTSVCQGIAYNFVTSQGMAVKNDVLKWIGTTKFFNDLLPVTVIIAAVFFVVYGIILAKTKFGRTIYVCGGNKQAAKLSGLNPTRLSYILFANCGFLASICGILVTSRVGTSYADSLSAYQFTGLTAAMLGGIAFGGGSGDMAGCFLGMLIIALFNNGTSVLGIDSNIATVFNGLLLIIALAIDAVNAKRTAKNWVKKSLLESESGSK